MPKNKLQDLRNHLFEALEKLQDNDMEVEKAEAIVKVGQAIINTGKLEYQYLKEFGGKQTDFFPEAEFKKELGSGK